MGPYYLENLKTSSRRGHSQKVLVLGVDLRREKNLKWKESPSHNQEVKEHVGTVRRKGISKNCPDRKKNSGHQLEKQDTTNLSDGYDNGELFTVSNGGSLEEWVIDLGRTFHMTPNQDWLLSYKQINRGWVLMGDDNPCKVIGIGSVKLQLWNGSVQDF